jgi:hypothetical protein
MTSAVAMLPRPSAERSPLSLRAYIEASGLRSVVIGPSKDPNRQDHGPARLADRTGTAVLAIKAPTTDAAARSVEREAELLVDLSKLQLPRRPARSRASSTPSTSTAPGHRDERLPGTR